MPGLWRRRRRWPGNLVWGAALASLLVLAGLLAPWLAPYDPAEQLDPAAARYRPPGTVLAAVHRTDGSWLLADRVTRTPEGLTLEHRGMVRTLAADEVANLTPEGVADRRVFLLGTDQFGRDVASRMLLGARVSLCVGLIAVILALTVGIAVGSAAALGGPVADALLMRTVDALLSFPWLFLMILIAALFRPGTTGVVLLLGSTSWMGIARMIRAELLGLRDREYVLAARSAGQHPLRILIRHLLPNALTPVLVQAALLIGNLILVESSLSFLGMGIQPPMPSWGNMIAEGHNVLALAWWISAFPGMALAVAVIAFNLLSDGLRDALDPQYQPATLPAA
jgi:peptide/nickel transport system permease protein